jgi:hypothetical protein
MRPPHASPSSSSRRSFRLPITDMPFVHDQHAANLNGTIMPAFPPCVLHPTCILPDYQKGFDRDLCAGERTARSQCSHICLLRHMRNTIMFAHVGPSSLSSLHTQCQIVNESSLRLLRKTDECIFTFPIIRLVYRTCDIYMGIVPKATRADRNTTKITYMRSLHSSTKLD